MQVIQLGLGLIPANEIPTYSESLSVRGCEVVLQCLALGASNREISRHLTITENTVKRHVYNIFGKLNVRNRTQAALTRPALTKRGAHGCNLRQNLERPVAP